MRTKPLRLIPFLIMLMLVVAAYGPAVGAKGTYAGPLAPNPNDNIKPRVDSKYYQVIIDKETQVVTVLRRDSLGKYTVIERQMVCSTGKTAGRTPLGTFKISTKRRWLNSPNYGVRIQYACRINGVIWIHSTCFYKYDPNTLERESYTDLGKPVSAGCIRLTVRDALWVYTNCPAGTVVKVVKSGGPLPVCLEPLPPLPDGASYDPTDESVAH